MRHDQSPKEEFKQGQRIRALLTEVKKGLKGAQIFLSRVHPNLVKKLFELEVPEIYEGIVEIKSLARQAGERTKIAVFSKNEKVDSVGACVGMRGNRVRNVVNELQGEKIDIVRYNEDIREYIKAALSPAEVSEIRLDKDKLRAEVIVNDDQLSLAIGKHGQNVRLASKLIGWELDIRTKESLLAEAEKAKAQAAQPQAEEVAAKQPKREKVKEAALELSALSGVGEKTVILLKGAGFGNLQDLAKAGIKDLLQIKGIGEKKAEKLIKEAKELIRKSR